MQNFFEITRQLGAIRLPLIMALVAGSVLALPDQIREIYRAMAQSFVGLLQDVPPAEILAAQCLAALVALGLVIWFVARRHAKTYVDERADAQGIARGGRPPFLLVWAPRVMAIVPVLAAAYGAFKARVTEKLEFARLQEALEGAFFVQLKREGLSDRVALRKGEEVAAELLTFNDLLLNASLLLLATAAFMLVVLIVLDRPVITRRLYDAGALRKSIVLGLLVAAAAVFVWLVTRHPVEIPQRIGTVALLCIFLVFLNLLLLQLAYWGRQTGLPLIWVFVLLPFVLGALDVNDNHWIRRNDTEIAALPMRTSVGDAFEAWYRQRASEGRFGPERRLPVYIVAAQGGGIYAGTHAASFLAELQDICPAFSRHLFAISGVSGGSVGASVFAGLTSDFDWSKLDPDVRNGCVADPHGDYRTYFTDAVSAVFDRDLMSPLAAAFLFPDFVQRFLPVPVPAFDRAVALERALEAAYRDGVLKSNFLPPEGQRPAWGMEHDFIHYWDPKAKPFTPALALNATEVSSGSRRVIAPFVFEGSGLGFLPVWRGEGEEKPITLPLSTAAMLSARFPWLTPAASFRIERAGAEPSRKLRLVDGGYFENSGAATGVDIVQGITERARALGISKDIDVSLFVFSSKGFTDPPRAYWLSEILEPIRTMLNSRAARAKIEVEKAFTVLARLADGGNVRTRVIELNLEGYGYPLPLGWQLSDITRHIIGYQSVIGYMKGPGLPPCSAGPEELIAAKSVGAECVKTLVYSQLR